LSGWDRKKEKRGRKRKKGKKKRGGRRGAWEKIYVRCRRNTRLLRKTTQFPTGNRGIGMGNYKKKAGSEGGIESLPTLKSRGALSRLVAGAVSIRELWGI